MFHQAIVSVYRLVVMGDTIPDFLYTGPGSQESTTAKALFYVFHCLPEWMGAALLVVPNTRKCFNSGPFSYAGLFSICLSAAGSTVIIAGFANGLQYRSVGPYFLNHPW